nr:phage major capsid protein [Enterococcus durans]
MNTLDIEKLKEQAQQALDSGDLETAKDLLAKIKEAKESKETDDQLKKDLADELKELDEETKATEIQEAKPKEQQAQPEKQESTEPTSNTNPIDKKDKEEKRSMEVILNDKKETYTRSINQFIRTKGEKRDGLTTVGAEAVIPVDRITKPEKQPETVVDLRQHVGRVPVTTGTGSYPILRANKNKMTSVAELVKNPELAKPEFTKVNYEIDTYRGYIPVSQEALDDSDIDLGGLVAEHIQRQSLNTSNAEIAKKLQTATAKTVTDIDGLKDIVNVTIDPAYNVKFIASQSFFNELDKMKDNDGRYLLQQDVTVASGYKLLGREVVVMADDVIGTKAGDKVAFVGDPSLFAKFFDRQQASVRWVDNDVYGQLLAGFIRFDVQVADNAAGFYVTLGPKA